MREHGNHPVGGVDYPRTIQEFDEWFASEPACAQFLQRLRWPTGFQCIAIEILSPRGFGRVRLRQLPSASAANLNKFVGEAVEPGSIVHTDGWVGYNALTKLGYGREISVLAKGSELAHVEMPGVHRVASMLKRWLLGTHQGAVSRKHLDYYLDEFTFRFNRRTSKARGLLFYRLAQQAAQVEPTPYATLMAAKKDSGHKR